MMSVQTIWKNKNDCKLSCMGKGSHLYKAKNELREASKQPISPMENKIQAANMATNYL